MWNMLWPLLLIIGSNTFYHICAKSTPEDAHAFGVLTVTYFIGLCRRVCRKRSARKCSDGAS